MHTRGVVCTGQSVVSDAVAHTRIMLIPSAARI